MFYDLYYDTPPKILNNPALDQLVKDLLAEHDRKERLSKYDGVVMSGSFTPSIRNVCGSGITMWRQGDCGYAKIIVEPAPHKTNPSGMIINWNGVKCEYKDNQFHYEWSLGQ